MISRGWKLVGLTLPILGSVAAWAAFTSPPFGGYPSQTVPMLWQCYSGLTERTSATCYSAPVHPSNVIPSRTHWYLVQCKATLKSVVDGNWWANPAWGVNRTNRLNSSNICALAGVGLDFWTNTPPAGMSTATNGWNGLMRVITNLQWTFTEGVPSTCNGSNVEASVSGSFCTVAEMETNSFVFVPSVSGFPIYEGRVWSNAVNTNRIYSGYVITEFAEDGDACDAPLSYYDSNSYVSCDAFVQTTWTDAFVCVAGHLQGNKYVHTLYPLSDAADTCPSQCGAPASSGAICAHVAPITFTNCTTATVYQAEEWYNSGATGTCAGATATFTDATGAGLSSSGWKKIFDYASTTVTGTVCRTDFATARVPWAGNTSTNPMAWAIYDALQVRKYNFNF